MARRNDHSRDELIEMALGTAERFLAERPIHAISARQIAKAMGYTVGTLYTLFDNLADLQLRVNGRTLVALHAACQATDRIEREPVARIQAYARAYAGFARTQPNRWRAVYSHILPAGQALPGWFQARVNALFDMVEQPLRELAPGRSPEQIAEAALILWGGVHGITGLALDDHLFAITNGSESHMTGTLIACFLDSWSQQA